jgi:hypothetical protein
MVKEVKDEFPPIQAVNPKTIPSREVRRDMDRSGECIRIIELSPRLVKFKSGGSRFEAQA